MSSSSSRCSSFWHFCFISSVNLLGVAIDNGWAPASKRIRYKCFSILRLVNSSRNSFLYLCPSILNDQLSEDLGLQVAGPRDNGFLRFSTTSRFCEQTFFCDLFTSNDFYFIVTKSVQSLFVDWMGGEFFWNIGPEIQSRLHSYRN